MYFLKNKFIYLEKNSQLLFIFDENLANQLFEFLRKKSWIWLQNSLKIPQI